MEETFWKEENFKSLEILDLNYKFIVQENSHLNTSCLVQKFSFFSFTLKNITNLTNFFNQILILNLLSYKQPKHSPPFSNRPRSTALQPTANSTVTPALTIANRHADRSNIL
jgi:hypothetical protein